jgi:exosortase
MGIMNQVTPAGMNREHGPTVRSACRLKPGTAINMDTTVKASQSAPMTLGAALRVHRVPLLLGAAAVVLAYHHVGALMVRDWYLDDNSSHGFLVPVISGYLVWLRRKELAGLPVVPCWAGLGLVVAAMVLLVAGWLASELFTMRSSLVLLLCGCVLFWLGREVFARLATPLLFLLFMVPIPAIVYEAVAFPLKLLVSRLSVDGLKAMGVMVLREGNIIMFPNISLEVVDACSGLRSLTSLLALGTAYSLIFCRSHWQRLLLVASTVPIAVLANVIRVTGTGLLARHIGAGAAEGFFHEFTGLVIFMLALAMLFGLHQVLRRFGP